MVYNVELISTVQQNESVIHIHIHIHESYIYIYIYIHIHPLSLGFISYSGHYSALNRVPCALRYVLTSYIFCI